MTVDARLASRSGLSRIAFVTAFLALVVTVLGLIGHLLRLPSLYSLHPGFQAMSFVTALGLGAIASGALADWFAALTLFINAIE